MTKKVMVVFLSLLLVLSFVSSVYAITGSIGNARMILRAKQGDEIEKYILVKNVNDVAIEVSLFASGDLADYVNIRDNNFSLEPGEDKKAYFTILAKKDGTTETKINVQFKPVDGKNGVGLSSTVIVIAEKNSLFDWGDSEDAENVEIDNNETQEAQETNSIIDRISSKITKEPLKTSLSKQPIVFYLLLITGVVFFALLLLLIIYSATYKPKKSRKRNE